MNIFITICVVLYLALALFCCAALWASLVVAKRDDQLRGLD
jgi:hypothetical protein